MRGDVAWGGNWFFLTSFAPCDLEFANVGALTTAATAISDALQAQGVRGKDGALIDHIEFFGPARSNDANSRNFVLCPGGAYDRSPCGTGTSAKLACLHADGKLRPGEVWVQESIIGSRFRASFEPGPTGGVLPRISGRAFICAESKLVQDALDPFRYGIRGRSRLNHFSALAILRLTAPPAPCLLPAAPGREPEVVLSRSIRGNRTMKTALVFPGQGSQAVGMGKALADEFRVAREIFNRVDGALDQKLSHLMFEGPEDQLTLTANAQPALMATSIAALRVLETETGFNPYSEAAYVAGHSLGEYSALCAADSLTLEDTARLLRLRGEAMQKAVPVGEGAMAAILGLDFGAVVKIATQAASDLYLTGAICQAANDNGGGQVVVSGTVAAVERAIELAKLAGAKRALLLPVSAPFHCALMQPAAEAMEEALKDVTIRPPKPPLVSNVEAEAVTNPDAIRSGLVAQVTATVRWRDSVTYMSAHGVTRFIELGSGKVLTGLIKRIVESGATTISIGAPADIAAFRASAQP